MAIQSGRGATPLSLNLVFRLAIVVLRFGHSLREQLDRHSQIDNPFGPASRRGLRLRATSNPDRSYVRHRSCSIRAVPAASPCHEGHKMHISDLIQDMDRHSRHTQLRVAQIASNDIALYEKSSGNVVDVLARSLSWEDAAYIFDSSTYLIEKLEAIYAAGFHASDSLHKEFDKYHDLQDEKYIANLIHLLRWLQAFLFDILVHKRSIEFDNHAALLRVCCDLQKNARCICLKEWPSGQRPLSTTWPWNIRPSLVVLWGVCWMFYPSSQDEDRPDESRPPYDPDTFDLSEDWGQSLPHVMPEEAVLNQSLRHLAMNRPSTQAEMLQHAYVSNVGQVAVQPRYQTPGQPISSSALARPFMTYSGPPLPHSLPSSTVPLGTARLSQGSSGAYVAGPPTIYSPGPGYLAHLADATWPGISGSDFQVPPSPRDLPTYQSNVWISPPTNDYMVSQPSWLNQAASSLIPTSVVSPVSGSTYSTLTVPSGQDWRQVHPSFQDLFPHNMDEGQLYPLSPQSDRQPSVSTSIPSPNSAVMSPERDSPHSNSSRRTRATIKRDQPPPRNESGKIYCDHEDCAGQNVTFQRPCEWNKHMDKHDRPYRCNEPGCEQSPGFTYSGGLLRHQREVHKMHMSTRQPLYCPFPHCNRSSGTGFTRRENLEEHKRRRHTGQSIESSSALQSSDSPSSTTLGIATTMRKRRRTTDTAHHDTEGEEEDDNNDDEDDEDDHAEEDSSSGTTSASQKVIKKLRQEIATRDGIIRQQQADLDRMRGMFRMPPPLAPATTA